MTARRSRRSTAPVDDGTPQVIETPIDEVGMAPPPEVSTPQAKQRNRKNLFNTELLLEAAKPEYNAQTFDDLIALCSYETSPALRTRVSQLVNAQRLDEKFRPPKPGRKAKT
jgi:hypothetical protein